MARLPVTTVKVRSLHDRCSWQHDLRGHRLLADLEDAVGAARDPFGRLDDGPTFEVAATRAEPGRLYAGGTMAFGGPDAPADSFPSVATRPATSGWPTAWPGRHPSPATAPSAGPTPASPLSEWAAVPVDAGSANGTFHPRRDGGNGPASDPTTWWCPTTTTGSGSGRHRARLHQAPGPLTVAQPR